MALSRLFYFLRFSSHFSHQFWELFVNIFLGDMIFHLEISMQVCKSDPNVALILKSSVGMFSLILLTYP